MDDDVIVVRVYTSGAVDMLKAEQARHDVVRDRDGRRGGPFGDKDHHLSLLAVLGGLFGVARVARHCTLRLC